jgi:flagellar P-ring protein FlgI
MNTRQVAGFVLVGILLTLGGAFGATRIKDIAYVQGVRGQQLIGYGLVVGLHGTGDTQRSTFTLQSVASMLKRFGITVSQDDLRLRNVAAVMVTATVPGFAKEGGQFDVTVSSMGDATSLQGGTLLLTPLAGGDGMIFATSQGPLSVGGMSVRANGNEVRRNHTASGRIPGGGILERAVQAGFVADSTVSIVLTQSDFTTANRVAQAVNAKFSAAVARAGDPSTVSILIPDAFREPGKFVEFVSEVELIEVSPDVAARVVINEKTGTVVVGGNVSILPVAISHGGLNIEIQSTPVISQPQSFSQGQTVSTQMTTVSAAADTAAVTAIDGAATVQDIARALNSLRVAPRDIIAIFQALKEVGALEAELVII